MDIVNNGRESSKYELVERDLYVLVDPEGRIIAGNLAEIDDWLSRQIQDVAPGLTTQLVAKLGGGRFDFCLESPTEPGTEKRESGLEISNLVALASVVGECLLVCLNREIVGEPSASRLARKEGLPGMGGKTRNNSERRETHHVPLTSVATFSELAQVLSLADLASLERLVIEGALERCNGQIYGDDGAAKALGMKPTTLYSRIKKWEQSETQQA